MRPAPISVTSTRGWKSAAAAHAPTGTHSRPRGPERLAKAADEIREIYVAELGARGLKQPSVTVLDAVVKRINGNPLPAARLAAESLIQVGKGIHALSRHLRSGG